MHNAGPKQERESHPLSNAAHTRLALRPGEESDALAIAELMRGSMGVREDEPAFTREFLRWKYWGAHPFSAAARSYLACAGERIVAHAGAWPVLLECKNGCARGIHLIDWAARREFAGAGVRAFSALSKTADATFSIAGSAITQAILPRLGFEQANTIWFVRRPLRATTSTLRSAKHDWKTPARILREAMRWAVPCTRLPQEWTIRRTSPHEIPARLFPNPTEGEAVARRSQGILAHAMENPLFSQARCYELRQHWRVIAYFLIAAAGTRARLIDYGPSGLDEKTAEALGIAAQEIARADFAQCDELVSATTEETIACGFRAAGLRVSAHERIRVRRPPGVLTGVARFRMTLLDWDACCL